MRIALLGAPGSGKGTQAKLLAEKYRVPHISTGDLLREAMNSKKGLGSTNVENMESGQLVDDEVVLKLLEDRLRKKDTKRGFIIDGYPRNIPQAQSLDALLGLLGRNLQVAVSVNVDDDILIKRIVGRLGCEDCGAIFNRYFSPSKVRNKCDLCSGKLSSRPDDTEKTVRVRIGVYHESTAPLITYYKVQHKLRNIPAEGSIEDIHEKICDIVDIEIRPLEIKTLETAADTADETESTVIAGGKINKVVIQSEEAQKEDLAPSMDESRPSDLSVSPGKVAKKTASKKKASKKKVAKKKAVAKAPTKKTSAKKTQTKKAQTKKVQTKKAQTKKAQSKKTQSKKSQAKKASTKVGTKKKAKKKSGSRKS